MKTIFVSDVHLMCGKDERANCFIRFLEEIAGGANRLVIVGDLFDFWVGMGKAIFYEYFPVLVQLSQLRKRGVEIHYIEGNHDFFLSPFFNEMLGMNIYKKNMVADFDGLRILATHGDLVDRKDWGHLLFQWLIKSRLTCFLLNFLPSSWLWKLGRALSNTSRRREFSEARLQKVRCLFIDYARKLTHQGFDAVVTGHIHQPEVLRLNEKTEKWYLNTGDWLTHQSFLVLKDKKFSLHHYHPSPS